MRISVGVPEHLLAFIDELVGNGDAVSRSEVVARALERERRGASAERDAAILRRAEPDSDLDGLAEFAAATFAFDEPPHPVGVAQRDETGPTGDNR